MARQNFSKKRLTRMRNLISSNLDTSICYWRQPNNHYEQPLHLFFRVRRRRPSGQSGRHDFRRRAGRLLHAGQVQPRRLRMLRQVQHRHHRRRNHHQGQARLRRHRAPGHPRNRLCQRRRRVSRGQGVRQRHRDAAVARHRAGRGRAQGQGQKDRQAGRRRPRPHVRLREQRDAGTHARADHVRAPSWP